MKDCIFCKISSGQISSEILYRDDHVFVIRDIAPKAPTHLLVIPLSHVTKAADLEIDDSPMIAAMFEAVTAMVLQEGIENKGYRLIINQGVDAGQVVDHLHMHILAGKKLPEMG
tara:strand:+ start:1214 stop:1555 length:342 start_codon:yes stop_codon:yes gene_type:complete